MKTLLLMSLFFSARVFAAETLLFADGALRAELTWLQGPRTPGMSELQIEWKSGVDQTRIEPPSPMKIVLWMPMPGHGPKHGHPSSPVTITKVDEVPGRYKVTDMYLTMAGAWEVRVSLSYTNGRQEMQTLLVNVKR